MPPKSAQKSDGAKRRATSPQITTSTSPTMEQLSILWKCICDMRDIIQEKAEQIHAYSVANERTFIEFANEAAEFKEVARSLSADDFRDQYNQLVEHGNLMLVNMVERICEEVKLRNEIVKFRSELNRICNSVTVEEAGPGPSNEQMQ
uniref:Uncharacterized protein n=1 Tax=Trichuris muris TaxID=70415 RepID=A0A5S6Q7U6_TRIMR